MLAALAPQDGGNALLSSPLPFVLEVCKLFNLLAWGCLKYSVLHLPL